MQQTLTIKSSLNSGDFVMKRIDYNSLIGQRFHFLTIIRDASEIEGNNKKKQAYCKCDCGKELIFSYHDLIYNLRKSCGCHKRLDLTGQIFGWLTVVERLFTKNRTLFRCICKCGKEKIVIGSVLVSGQQKSCGCNRTPQKTKKYRDHPLYDVWKGFKARCRDKKHSSYHNYGARGIKVCDEWEKDFIKFYEWAINNGYETGLEIDRIDNDGNYEPSNCQFLTHKENGRKTRRLKLNQEKANNIKISIKSFSDLAKEYGVSESTIRRVKKGEVWH